MKLQMTNSSEDCGGLGDYTVYGVCSCGPHGIGSDLQSTLWPAWFRPSWIILALAHPVPTQTDSGLVLSDLLAGEGHPG